MVKLTSLSDLIKLRKADIESSDLDESILDILDESALNDLNEKLENIEGVVKVDVMYYIHSPKKFYINNSDKVSDWQNAFELGYLVRDKKKQYFVLLVGDMPSNNSSLDVQLAECMNVKNLEINEENNELSVDYDRIVTLDKLSYEDPSLLGLIELECTDALELTSEATTQGAVDTIRKLLKKAPLSKGKKVITLPYSN